MVGLWVLRSLMMHRLGWGWVGVLGWGWVGVLRWGGMVGMSLGWGGMVRMSLGWGGMVGMSLGWGGMVGMRWGRVVTLGWLSLLGLVGSVMGGRLAFQAISLIFLIIRVLILIVSAFIFVVSAFIIGICRLVSDITSGEFVLMLGLAWLVVWAGAGAGRVTRRRRRTTRAAVVGGAFVWLLRQSQIFILSFVVVLFLILLNFVHSRELRLSVILLGWLVVWAAGRVTRRRRRTTRAAMVGGAFVWLLRQSFLCFSSRKLGLGVGLLARLVVWAAGRMTWGRRGTTGTSVSIVVVVAGFVGQAHVEFVN
jgi:hypothetical protein